MWNHNSLGIESAPSAVEAGSLGIELKSPALQGGFLTVGPPGTSLLLLTKQTKQKQAVD